MKKKSEKEKVLAEFKKIPGVGTSIAQDLWNLGLRSLDDLKKQDPQQLYDALCKYQGCNVDRCMLYVFRCAIYFVNVKDHDPKLLKWWHWKD